MQVVAGVAAIVIALVAVAAALAVYRSTFRSFQDTWRRVPPERRGLASFGIGMMLVGGVAGAVLLIVQPWGTKTGVWLILVGVPAWTLVWLVAFSVQVVMEGRRSRTRRAPNP
jgi:hypothetical protein